MGAFMSAIGEFGKTVADTAGLAKDYSITAKDWVVDKGEKGLDKVADTIDEAGDRFMAGYNKDENAARQTASNIGLQDTFGVDSPYKEDFSDTDTEKLNALLEKGAGFDGQDFSYKPKTEGFDLSVDGEKKEKGGIRGALAKAMMNEDTSKKSAKDDGPRPPSLPQARGPNIVRGGPVSGGDLGRGKASVRDFTGNRFK